MVASSLAMYAALVLMMSPNSSSVPTLKISAVIAQSPFQISGYFFVSSRPRRPPRSVFAQPLLYVVWAGLSMERGENFKGRFLEPTGVLWYNLR